MTLRRVWLPSPNYSSRAGTRVRLVVVHTAEGALSIESLGNFFANPASGVSSHTGADDKPNTVGEFVHREQKAWTQGNANPYSVAIELCAFAAWTPAEWNAHPVMLENCAAWIAEECRHFGIPIRRLSASEAQGGAMGVCGHNELGAAGGGHWDPGPNFPWERVIDMAIGGAPAPDKEPEIQDMGALTSMLDEHGNIVVFGIGPNGDLFEFTTKDAPPGKTYRCSNISANAANGQKLAV